MREISAEQLAEFEAAHGKVKRRRQKPRTVKPVMTAEQAFAQAWESDPLPGAQMVTQYKFHPTRDWRFDFAWPQVKLAVELEGFGSAGDIGRHQTFVGFRGDCEKYTAAALRGWRLLRFLSADKKQVQDWLRTVKLALCGMEE